MYQCRPLELISISTTGMFQCLLPQKFFCKVAHFAQTQQPKLCAREGRGGKTMDLGLQCVCTNIFEYIAQLMYTIVHACSASVYVDLPHARTTKP